MTSSHASDSPHEMRSVPHDALQQIVRDEIAILIQQPCHMQHIGSADTRCNGYGRQYAYLDPAQCGGHLLAYHPNGIPVSTEGTIFNFVEEDPSKDFSTSSETPSSGGDREVSPQLQHDHSHVNAADYHLSPLVQSIEQPLPPTFYARNTRADTISPVTPNNNLMHALRDASLTCASKPLLSRVQSESRLSLPRAQSESASRLKRTFTEMQGRTGSGKRLMGENDPENREILRLRQEENYEFDRIAEIINRKRVKSGAPANLTANAIYSRYKRNGPLIAAAEGREFTPAPRDRKANGQGIQFKKATVVTGFDPREDELLVRAFNDIEERHWELVAARVREIGGKDHDATSCAIRYAHL